MHIPAKKLDKIPILFCLHGGGGTAEGMIKLTQNRFNELADNEGFIVVYPQGVDKGWNDGRTEPYSTANKEHIDDVGFILKIITELKSKYSIDNQRVFTCGMSNGGFMSARLGCELSETIAVIGIIAATMGEDYFSLCKPIKPIKVIEMNGTADPLVPYNGGELKVFNKSRGYVIAAEKSVEFWVSKNGCNKNPIIQQLPDIVATDEVTVEKSIYKSAESNNDVVFYKLINGGHTWPGGKQYLGKWIIGNTCRDFNACDEIWNFFKGNL